MNGTITSWGAGTNTNGGAPMVSLRLRVINPLASPIAFVRSGAIESRPSQGEHIFTSSIPIGIGERVALEILTASHAAQGLVSQGYAVQYWEPVPSDGSGAPPTATFPDQLVELFADVEPSNSIPEPSIRRNKKKGTAQMTVDLPNGGELLASSPSGQSSSGAVAAKKKKPLIKPAAASATSAGPVTLTLRPTKGTKRRLREKGKAKGRVSLTFTPSFGTAGTRDLTVKLKRRR